MQENATLDTPITHGNVENSRGWFSWLWSWKPTNNLLLEAAEIQMLKKFNVPFEKKMVKIRDNVYINTLKAGNGPPLVMLHGFAAGIGFWVCNLKELSKHHTVYCIDLLGFGRSSRAPFTGKTAEEADDYFLTAIEDWRKAMNLEKFTILGHSFGGYLSFLYSLKHPETINHLILADPWGVPRKDEAAARRIPFHWRFLIKCFSYFNPLAIIRITGPYGPKLISRFRGDLMEKFVNVYDDPSLVTQYIYHMNAQSPSGEAAFYHLLVPIGYAKNPIWDRNIESLPQNIRVTMMYGDRTWMDPKTGLKVKERLGNRASFHTIPYSGHHVYVDNYEEFNRIIISRKVSTEDESN